MARTQVDRGPVVAFPIPGVATAIPNIGLTVSDARGPALLRATVEVDHGGLGTGNTTCRILKNGVLLGNAEQTIRMIGPDRAVLMIEELDAAPVAADLYTVDIVDTVVDPLNVVPINRACLVFDAIGKDAAAVSNVGAVTA